MELYANAAAVPTTLRGDVHGHIGLVIDTTFYSMLSTTTFAASTQPTRATLPPRATIVDRETMEHKYKIEKAIHGNHNTVEKAVQAQIQDVIENIYLQ
eukprot:105646-Ditylum_brightwellii.AAC.1